MSQSKKQLNRAFKLIKQDQIDDALDILRPIVVEEPDNVHAWWLLAYAATEPREVREALIMVLRIDPGYENAPKAREMLEKLNEQYPPDDDEISRYPELQQSSLFESFEATEDLFDDVAFKPSPFEDLRPEPMLESEFDLDVDPFEDVFGDPDFVPPTKNLFVTEVEEATISSAQADTQRVGFDRVPAEEEIDDLRLAMLDMGIDPDLDHDDQTLAAAEERVSRRQERRGRGLRRLSVLIALLAIVLIVVIGAVVLSGQGEEKDPGTLDIVEVTGDKTAQAQSSANADVQAANLSMNAEAVLGKSSLGNALYVEFCSVPDPNLPQIIARGMEIVAKQAPGVQDELKAVGVSISDCGSEEYDTLYRAVAPIDKAVQYQQGEIDWVTFQKSWDAS